jgi:hypothetical protein
MSRTKIFKNWQIPQCIVTIVYAVCADYSRRAKEIFDSSRIPQNPDKIAKYIALNNAVDDSLEFLENGIRKEMMKDIVYRRGYQKSGLQVILCKEAYYNRRNKVIHDIAEKLNLI